MQRHGKTRADIRSDGLISRGRCATVRGRMREIQCGLRSGCATALGAAVLVWCGLAHAIRPFVTDDARVVGNKFAQLETWVLLDRLALEHNVLAALGPTDWLEVTTGFVHGGVHRGDSRGYSISGPVLQAKALLLAAVDGGRPGLALAGGGLAPWGHGAFEAPGWGGFSYVALTESLFAERLLVHANLGLAVAEQSPSSGAGRLKRLLTLGVGVQGHLIAGLHGVAEVYRGDPYDASTDFPAAQAGFRYLFSERVQADSTFGTTLTTVSGPGGEKRTERWGTLGVRLVSSELW